MKGNAAPSDLSAEHALLACAMLDAGVLDLVRVSPRDFFDPRCQASWRAALELHEQGKPVDPLTIADAVSLGEEARKGLPTFLSGLLVSCVVIASNAEHYAEIVLRHAKTRRVLLAAADLQDAAKHGAQGDELASLMLERACAIDAEQTQDSCAVSDLVMRRYRELEVLMDRDEHATVGHTTGLRLLDEILGGVQPGVLTLVAGRPSMGKSSLARMLADVNTERGIGVHVFSLEDTQDVYLDRAIADHADVAVQRLRAGTVDDLDEQRAVRRAAQSLCERSTWCVDDRSGIGADEIVRSVRRMRRTIETQIVIVDYVQLLPRARGLKAHEAITEHVHAFAAAAKQDGIAYVVLSQLNRKCEERDDKRPRLSDLKECGTLDDAARVVIAIYRPSMHDQRADETLIELHVLKNSNGETGYCEAYWNGPTTRIQDA